MCIMTKKKLPVRSIKANRELSRTREKGNEEVTHLTDEDEEVYRMGTYKNGEGELTRIRIEPCCPPKGMKRTLRSNTLEDH